MFRVYSICCWCLLAIYCLVVRLLWLLRCLFVDYVFGCLILCFCCLCWCWLLICLLFGGLLVVACFVCMLFDYVCLWFWFCWLVGVDLVAIAVLFCYFKWCFGLWFWGCIVAMLFGWYKMLSVDCLGFGVGYLIVFAAMIVC